LSNVYVQVQFEACFHQAILLFTKVQHFIFYIQFPDVICVVPTQTLFIVRLVSCLDSQSD